MKKSIFALVMILVLLFVVASVSYAKNSNFSFTMANTKKNFNRSNPPAIAEKTANDGKWGVNIQTFTQPSKGAGACFRNLKLNLIGTDIAGEEWKKTAGKTSWNYITGKGVKGFDYELRARYDDDFDYGNGVTITGVFATDA